MPTNTEVIKIILQNHLQGILTNKFRVLAKILSPNAKIIGGGGQDFRRRGTTSNGEIQVDYHGHFIFSYIFWT